jgi:hypothetical protein
MVVLRLFPSRTAARIGLASPAAVTSTLKGLNHAAFVRRQQQVRSVFCGHATHPSRAPLS